MSSGASNDTAWTVDIARTLAYTGGVHSGARVKFDPNLNVSTLGDNAVKISAKSKNFHIKKKNFFLKITIFKKKYRFLTNFPNFEPL